MISCFLPRNWSVHIRNIIPPSGMMPPSGSREKRRAWLVVWACPSRNNRNASKKFPLNSKMTWINVGCQKSRSIIISSHSYCSQNQEHLEGSFRFTFKSALRFAVVVSLVNTSPRDLKQYFLITIFCSIVPPWELHSRLCTTAYTCHRK